jgi:hypothetical protein
VRKEWRKREGDITAERQKMEKRGKTEKGKGEITEHEVMKNV